MSQGVGPKLKQLLLRGVGVHHAGVLPKYRRVVEKCFQRKLLAVCACTETLSAGINLPARSVVLPSLIKGPKGKKRLIPFGTAHQIFGRAGRPQFDTQGYVFALAHPDDVKILRWQKKYDQIPENTPDPNLQKAKKQLKKKQPKRSPEEQYWNEKQFEILRDAKAENLHSVGQIPWRLLAYMLSASADVQILRKLVKDRLFDSGRMEKGQKDLDDMLLTLCRSGYVTLEPTPPAALVPEVDEMPGINPEDVKYPEIEPAYLFLFGQNSDLPNSSDDTGFASENEARPNGSAPLPEPAWAPELQDPDAEPADSPALPEPSSGSDSQTVNKTAGLDKLGSPKSGALESGAASGSESGAKSESDSQEEDGGFGFGLFDDEEEAKLSDQDKKAQASNAETSACISDQQSNSDIRPNGSDLSVDSPNAPTFAQKKSADEPNSPLETADCTKSNRTSADQTADNRTAADRSPVLTLGMSDQDKAALLAKRPGLRGQIEVSEDASYEPIRARATEKLEFLTQIRSLNPLYGVFLLEQLADADTKERIQAFESVLELPTTLLRNVRVPKQYELPPGRLAQGRLDRQLLQLGLATIDELVEKTFEEIQAMRNQFGGFPDAEERVWVIPFAEKLFRLFQYQYPKVQDVSITPVWAAGELLEFNGDFNKYITSKGLQRQEGLVFRHLLRLILLLEEFAALTPPRIDVQSWRDELLGIANYFRDCCHRVDPMGTDEILAREEKERAEE